MKIAWACVFVVVACSSSHEVDRLSTPELAKPIALAQTPDARFLTYTCNPSTEDLRLYWKGADGEILKSFSALKAEVNKQGKELVFAANAGMFMENRHPLGLYIERGETHRKMNRTQTAHGNFYLQPNGVFYLTAGKQAGVCVSTSFEELEGVDYATQSGPMLLVDGAYHPALTKGSKNLHIRNGVGILPNGNVLFVMSKERVNFYDLATYFKDQGCKNALYLDGFVSRTYLPEQGWEQTGGAFGVMIGVAK